MTCPNCGAGLGDCSRFCNYCGQAQQPSPPPNEQSFADNAEGGEPYRRYQPPQPPSRGIGAALDGKTHLLLALCCFGWAGLVGLPRCVGFIVSLFRWNWGSFSLPSFSGFFNLGLNLVLPLALGAALLHLHRRNNP